MEYIRVTKENIESEHICCAISNNKDVQVFLYKGGSYSGRDLDILAYGALVCRFRFCRLGTSYIHKRKSYSNDLPCVHDERRFGKV